MIARVAKSLSRHRAATAVGLAALTALSAWLLATRRFSSDILDILPLKDRVIARQYEFLSVSGAMREVVLDVCAADSAVTFADLAGAARQVADALGESGLFERAGSVEPRDILGLRNLLLANWPDLFSPADSAWVVSRLGPDSLRGRLDTRLAALFTFGDISADGYSIRHDPFGLAEFSLGRLSAFKPVEDIAFEEGFLTNNSRTRVLVLARTAGEYGSDEPRARRAAALLDTLEQSLAARGIRLNWMGALRASRDNVETIKRDVHLTAPAAALLILLICILVYRRFHYGLLVFLPTVAGILMTLGLFSLFDRVSIIVLGFSAALLGITVDYAVHYLYHVDDIPGDSDPVATLAPPIFASALTTAAAFGILVIAGLPGLSQLGSVTAVGIMIVAILSMVVLPAFVRPSRAGRPAPLRPARWFEGLYGRRVHRLALWPLVFVSAVCWFCVGRLSFEGDPGALNGMKPETIETERVIAENWRGLSEGTFLVVSALSRDSALAKAHSALEPLVDTLVAAGLVMPARVVSGLVPPEAVQRENRARWNAVFTGKVTGLMQEAIRETSRRFSLDWHDFLPYLVSISNVGVDRMPLLTFDDFGLSVREHLFGNHLHQSGARWYASVPVFARGDKAWERVSELAGRSGVLAVNDAVLGQRVVEIIRNAFMRCVVFIPAVVFAVLLLLFRSVVRAAVAFVPSILAAGITLGGMAILGMEVNIVSLMIFSFVFGLGIDYTLLLLHLCTVGGSDEGYVRGHGAASVTVAALTTLAGLGILALAHHPVLVTVGRTGLLGITASYLCAIVCVPALAEMMRRR